MICCRMGCYAISYWRDGWTNHLSKSVKELFVHFGCRNIMKYQQHFNKNANQRRHFPIFRVSMQAATTLGRQNNQTHYHG